MSRLLDELKNYGADVDGVMDRFMEDEELLEACLDEYLLEDEYSILKKCIDEHRYEDAFEVAHALKGVVGNLGLVPLFEATCIVVEALRAKDYSDIDNLFNKASAANDTFVNMYKGLKK